MKVIPTADIKVGMKLIPTATTSSWQGWVKDRLPLKILAIDDGYAVIEYKGTWENLKDIIKLSEWELTQPSIEFLNALSEWPTHI